MSEDSVAHWTDVYEHKDPDEVSWYQPEPTRSLQLIDSAHLPLDAAIIDVGGGASKLALRLLEAGYTDVTVADISPSALARATAEAGQAAGRISWVLADARRHVFARRYDVWHDRAVFHFMVTPHDRAAYLATLRRSLRPGGHLIIATFGPEGPERCSGLPTARYDTDALSAVLGGEFLLVRSGLETHRTPGGSEQQFLYAHFRRRRDE
jgi:SAM-dependent methyltransferase